MKNVVYVKTELVHPHPKNPRKELRGIEELAESIKVKGILQNLTVTPMPDKEGEYYLLIGHRRFAGAQMAGLEEVPVTILEGLSEAEQVSIMLVENIQRDDLTIREEAGGFQMMLDLGDTAETIAEKTGKSKTTVYHRLNIAKLDDKILKKKEEDKSFQLSMQDLYALEKIEDVKERNRVLKEANSSSNLKWMAERAAKEAEEKRKRKIYEKMFKAAGIEKAKGTVSLYDGKWDKVKQFDFDKEPPKELRLPKTKETMFYFENYSGIFVIKKAKKKAKTKYEIEREEKEAKKKQIKNVIKNLNKRRKEFLQEILSGKIEQVKEEPDIKEEIWNVLLAGGIGISMSNIRYFFTEKHYYDCSQEELEEADKKIAGLSMTEQMLIAMNYMLNNISDIYDYSGEYRKSTGETMVSAYEVLKRYGWYFEEGEEDILTGKSPLYEEG